MPITLDKINKKNGSIITQDDILKIDNNTDKIQNIINTLSSVAISGSYNDLTEKPIQPVLASVATSGSYNDLTEKPTIIQIVTMTESEYTALTTHDINTIYLITG